MLEKKGDQWKDRSGRSHGRRRSSGPFPINNHPLQGEDPPTPAACPMP